MRPLRALGAAGWRHTALVAAIIGFYFWTAVPAWDRGLVARTDGGYYNLLTRGFLQGHLYLDLPVDPFFATLADPWSPAQRAGHPSPPDASYYRGRYYIYYGVSPAILLFLPFRLLTGRFLSEVLASPLFASIGLLAAVWLLLAARRRYFARAPEWAVTACILALGLADMMAVLLRRTSVREVPITCGYACGMTALAALFLALHHRRPAPWLAAAGAAVGLAVGSRPLYLLLAPILLLPAWLDARERGLGPACWRDQRWRKLLLAALVPLALVCVGLALYNTLRFGDPAEFGLRYQYWNDDPAQATRFAWRFFTYNLHAYWLAPAGWGRFFPFVTFARLPAAPAGFYGAEDPYGLLPNMPFVFLALGVLVLAAPESPASERRLRLFTAGVALTAAAMTLPLLFFQAALNRYMVDFAPTVVLLACLGLLALVTRPWCRGSRAGLTALAVAGLAGYSAAFNVLASLRHNELFRAQQPARYRQLAHAANWLSRAYDQARGTPYGPIELRVEFPPYAGSAYEPLVVTGRSFLSDYLFVHYLGPGSVQFGFEHTSRGTLLGGPVEAAPGRAHVLRIDLGSLYPPADHPYFDSLPPAEARTRQEMVRVIMDGRVALDGSMAAYDAASPIPSLGSSQDRPAFPRAFSGRILSWGRIPEASAAALASGPGPVRLEVILPPFGAPRSEPLLCAGAAGRGDLIYVRYESPDRISFGYDHWGVGGAVSPSWKIDPQSVQVIELDCGALHPFGPGSAPTDSTGSSRDRLLVRLNGQAALDEPAPYYSDGLAAWVVGRNSIGASSASARFTGEIVRAGRGREP